MANAVAMRNIVKRFPLVLANDHVDFGVEWGEVHALIGENGAGKSTLMKILYGMQPPDEGTISVDGQEVILTSAKDAIKRGIGMVHQHFMLVETLTVAENLVLGAEPHIGPSLNYRVARRKTRELIERFGFDIDPDSKISELPLGLQQQVEILKTLYRNARILIMDEPTAVLTPQETRGLFRFVREFAEAGNAVVFISHKLDEVMEICDRMSVMRDGQMIGTVKRDETDQRRLANMMVGREVILRVEKTPPQPKKVELEVTGVTVRHPIKHKPLVDDVSFRLRAGEILGLAGIEGNGQSELVEAIVGLRTIAKGTISLGGRDMSEATARQRREAGLSHIPEDRNERGLVGSYTTAMNSILGDHHRPPYCNRWGFLREEAIEKHAAELVSAYDVRPTSTEIMAASYSGGNAQKLIVAREVERGPDILIASQPTRGVDIGAIEFIHKQIIAARDKGLAVLLVSADLNEVMSLSDRIMVMYEGKIMGELTQDEATTETLGLLMAGSSPQDPPAQDTRFAYQNADVNTD
ncbi:MAG: ABC transporter ATP-binding protein [Trueperaceae bacterium]|nr:ABC transporter ATP-binding protein [Trueperaceae bacterium]